MHVPLRPGPYLLPMPTVLVGSHVGGKPNFMTAAFCGVVNYNPVIVVAGLNPTHLTTRGITENNTFSLNIPSVDQVGVTDWVGLHSGEKVDKASLFEVFYGTLGTAPMIRQCALCAELKLLTSAPYSVDTAWTGEVVSVHADESVLTKGQVDWQKVNPLLFTFPDPTYWRLGERVAKAWSVGKTFTP